MGFPEIVALGAAATAVGGIIRLWFLVTAGVRKDSERDGRITALEKEVQRLETRDGRIFGELKEIRETLQTFAVDAARREGDAGCRQGTLDGDRAPGEQTRLTDCCGILGVMRYHPVLLAILLAGCQQDVRPRRC